MRVIKYFALVFISLLTIVACSVDENANQNFATENPEPEQPQDDDMTPETPQNAKYSVTFIGEWTAESHPDSFPSNDHFSSTILFTHDTTAALYEDGELASDGIEDMSEIGENADLISEMQAYIDAGQGLEFMVGNCCIDGNGTDQLLINASQDFSKLSYVAMVAPSPDWFTGVSSISLFENNQWVQSIEVDVVAYDAGTENGNTFSYNNAETSPREAIRRITEAPLGNGTTVSPRLGKLVITLQEE